MRRPGRTPSGKKVVDVVQAAMVRRAAAARATTNACAWGPAMAAAGTLAAVLVLARQARPVVEAAAWSWRFAEQALTTIIGPIGTARLAGWVLLVAALVAGWRTAAAIGAGAAVLAELAVLATGVRDHAAPGWHLLLAVVVAVPLCGSLLLAARDGCDQRPLPGRFWAAAAAMGLCASLSAAGAPLVADRFGNTVAISTIPVARIGFGALAVVALFSLVAVLALPVAVRRRAVVLLAAVAALLATTQLGYDEAFMSMLDYPVLRDQPAMALALAAVAATVVLTLGTLAVRSREGASR
ncbi:hypothetical protein O7553_04785 [Solwaraspora sp. WMMA2059]|uniref:hypothetical protein n=1 Tax=Solwaraspora sp. WMMA2059 TaxID=3015160 RepID=UPI00248BCB09|nr:hypothetical protein [Solwaraspora sp. WMMA2059]WBB98258.1 hypothetical protein O7553_04785 [Solwaraspora sp. WMMA2059]